MTNPSAALMLDRAQHDAVTAPQGPVLVEGGPGTGKSFVLTVRLARLLAAGAEPKSIFRLTPDRRQVPEIRRTLHAELSRVKKNVPSEGSEAVQVASIQGLAEPWLRHLGPGAIGIPREFAVWSPQRSEETIRQLLSSSGLNARIFVGDIPDILRWHRHIRSKQQPDVPGIPSLWHEVIDLYEKEKGRQNALDHEDLTVLVIRALEARPDTVRSWRERIRPHFLVDDFQNLTGVQYRFLQILAGANGSVVAAGDRNQCVGTSWGADAGLMKQFLEDNPSCTHIRLPINHRANEALHDFAIHLARSYGMEPLPKSTGQGNASSIERRGTKPILFVFPGSQAEMHHLVANQINSAVPRDYAIEDVAILVRRHSSIDIMAPIMSEHGIPIRVLGQDRTDGTRRTSEGLTISTFHAARGRQWRHVWLMDVCDHIVPGPISPYQRQWIFEERRLLFVAATRAAESLRLGYCTENGRAEASRFLIITRPSMDSVDLGLSPYER